MAKKLIEIPVTRNQANTVAEGIRETLNLADDMQVGVFLKPKKKMPIPNYAMIFQGVGMMAVKEINPSSLAVFWLFICKLQWGTHVGCDQTTIAEETNLALPTVKKALKQLTEKNMILSYKDLQDKRRNVYVLNPLVVWKGESKERIKQMKKITELNPNQLEIFGRTGDDLPMKKKAE